MKRLLGLGANGIITDRPDIAAKVWVDLSLKQQKNEPTISPPSPTSFYTPLYDFYEHHTCVSLICLIVRYCNRYIVFGFIGVIVSLIKLFKDDSKKKVDVHKKQK